MVLNPNPPVILACMAVKPSKPAPFVSQAVFGRFLFEMGTVPSGVGERAEFPAPKVSDLLSRGSPPRPLPPSR